MTSGRGLALPYSPGGQRGHPALMAPLPSPSIPVASRNDAYASFQRSADIAGLWGSHLVDAGEAGHINADSGLADWPLGMSLVRRLLEAASLRDEVGLRLARAARFFSREEATIGQASQFRGGFA